MLRDHQSGTEFSHANDVDLSWLSASARFFFGRTRRRPVDTIVAILREKLADLDVAESDLRRHAEAYLETLSQSERALLVGLTGLALPSGTSLLGRYRPPPSRCFRKRGPRSLPARTPVRSVVHRPAAVATDRRRLRTERVGSRRTLRSAARPTPCRED